jgi:alkylhydroperoxidase/carboxymuconolactone decarboxylase family protein YurZ
MTMEQILEPKTQLLVALGAAAAAKCQHCFAKLYGMTDAAGVSAQEVRAAVAIADTVAQKSHGFMSAFIAETTNGAVAARAAESAGCGCGCGAAEGESG